MRCNHAISISGGEKFSNLKIYVIRFQNAHPLTSIFLHTSPLSAVIMVSHDAAGDDGGLESLGHVGRDPFGHVYKVTTLLQLINLLD